MSSLIPKSVQDVPAAMIVTPWVPMTSHASELHWVKGKTCAKSKSSHSLLWLSLLAVLGFLSHRSNQASSFSRHPRRQVVFTYAGDLWLASTSGGMATRLTAHPGVELFAKFSPDGKWIAFTGQYDGDEQVYVIPVYGGRPEAADFYPSRGPLPARWGYDNQVYGWTPDGKSVVFRSLREYFDLMETRACTRFRWMAACRRLCPMPKSGAGDFSPDGARLSIRRLFRDFRTWKRYSGGWAQQLYIFDLKSHAAARRSPPMSASHRDPMWIGDKIYYSSDKDDTLNLYSYDPQDKDRPSN